MIPILFFAGMLATQQDSVRLTVTAAIDRALATHPALAAARASVEAASADVGQARAAWLPSIGLEGSVNRFEKPMIVWPLHGLDLRNPPTFDTQTSQAALGASYTLFDFGARSAKVRAAESSRDAADASAGATEQALVARTLVAYLKVLTARGVLTAEDQRYTALASEMKRSRERFSAGKAARVDTLRAASELASAAADRVQSAASVEVAEHDLARLTGMSYESIHTSVLLPVALSPVGAAAPVERTAATARVQSTNAEVLAAEQRAEAASASVGAAKATRLPQLNANSAIVDRSNITGRWLSEWQVGLGISWPLYTGGARQSAISRAEATSRAAQKLAELARLNAEQQADDARAMFESALARISALEAAEHQATEVARITALSRDVGDGTQTDYLLAEAALFKARSGLVQARHAMIAARAELARVLGELNRAWIATALESQK